jgi:hypothetical protein
MKKLELVLFLPRGKYKEFNQSLEILKEGIKDICTSLETQDSQDDFSFSLIAQWESEEQMHLALACDEFKILRGAIDSLCHKTTVRFNDKHVGNHISKLKSL